MKLSKNNFSKKLQDCSRMPGWNLVAQGFDDISHKRYHTIHALLILMAQPRLRFLGFNPLDYHPKKQKHPFHIQLYHALKKNHKDAYEQYNSLQRRLASFCASMEQKFQIHVNEDF